MVRMAMGSDTGGSIRGPAAWCGTVGIKPTYGRVSRRGVFPLSWTLDHIGPLTRNVEDAAITLQVLAGHDPLDPASANVPVPEYRADLEKGVAGLRIGIPRAFFATAQATTREVVAELDRIAAAFRAAGAMVEDIELPDYALFSATGRVIMMAEAFAIHEADMRTRLLDYGEITAGRFILGAAITAADFIHALRARRELTDAVNATLSRYDALLTLSALDTAPRFDQPMDAMSAASPIQTIPFNVTGHPAMSVPTSLAKNGSPIGVQIIGRPFDEAMVFRVGRAAEKLSGWECVSPPGG
jgi:aspartyl-tRNA(Asn)/glutamyl-tRNA(Gln) amidotransferase subunit A